MKWRTCGWTLRSELQRFPNRSRLWANKSVATRRPSGAHQGRLDVGRCGRPKGDWLYISDYSRERRQSYISSAEPARYGHTGKLSFWMDQTGNIKKEDNGGKPVK